MTYSNFKKSLNSENTKSIGKAHCTEPIIISGKYFGIKLLSVYEFMECLKMEKALLDELTDKEFDKNICPKLCEHACLVSMCLYSSTNTRIFATGLEALKNLTPEELKFIYEEYAKLLNKIVKKDKITQSILEKAKRYCYN